MRRDPWLVAAIAAGLFLSGAGLFVLADTWFDKRAAVAQARARIADLRARRLDPRDLEAIKRMLAAAPDPQTGLLAAGRDEAVPRLEAAIRLVAREHKAESISLSFANGTSNDGLPVVRGDFHLAVGDDRLESLLRVLETGPPAAFWERLRISYKPPENDDPGSAVLDVTASMLVYRDIPPDERPVP
jgi:hypothetical protein